MIRHFHRGSSSLVSPANHFFVHSFRPGSLTVGWCRADQVRGTALRRPDGAGPRHPRASIEASPGKHSPTCQASVCLLSPTAEESVEPKTAPSNRAVTHMIGQSVDRPVSLWISGEPAHPINSQHEPTSPNLKRSGCSSSSHVDGACPGSPSSGAVGPPKPRP